MATIFNKGTGTGNGSSGGGLQGQIYGTLAGTGSSTQNKGTGSSTQNKGTGSSTTATGVSTQKTNTAITAPRTSGVTVSSPSAASLGTTDMSKLSQLMSGYGQAGMSQVNAGNAAQQNALNGITGLMNDYKEKYGAFNQMLQGLNNSLQSGYQQLNNVYNTTVTPQYQQVQQAMNNVKNGVVPAETQKMIDSRYNLETEQARQKIQDQFNRQQADLLDNLGARGILNSTTSTGAITGLGTNTLKSIQDMASTFGQNRLQTLLDEPYKQLEAQQGVMNSALGAYNAAGNRFGSLLSSVGQQAQMGQAPLTNIINALPGYANMAQIGSGMVDQGWGPMLDIWGNLLNAETQRLVSQNQSNAQIAAANAANGGGSSGFDWGSLAGSLIGGLF